MSTKGLPQIPPRPTRAHDQPSSNAGSTLGSDIPKIPPRPTNRRIERSVSPHRDSFAPSPLNEPSFVPGHGAHKRTSLYSSGSANNSNTDLPPRPPSVVLPSLGQEGSEYAEVFPTAEQVGTSPTQTRNIANDLQLYAPKPSLPVSSAKQRVSTVTRTDSSQAAALGIGKPSSYSDDKEPQSRSLKSKSSIVSQHSSGTERPPSSADNEHGIPEIGQRVPMYPDAGDVQAPSPSPFATHFQPGIGFHNDGSKPRHHGRRKSGKGFEGPPGSYGLHGHGVVTENMFEKAYYEKHPELLKKEAGQYGGAIGEGRGEWALSSEDLNKIVRDTASRASGLGTTPGSMAPPDEQIGFLASEEYASRMSSPRPQSASLHKPSNASQTHVDSPLRKESFTAEALGKAEFEGAVRRGLHHDSDIAMESEFEDDEVVHVDAPEHRINKIYGGVGDIESKESLGAYHGEEEEHGYSAPILASDEVAKEPFGYDLQPAVSPMQERRGSASAEPLHHQRTGSGPSSRQSSRPSSIHGVPGIRYQSEFERDSHSTPLEDLDEYEPLFPEDEHRTYGSNGRPLTAADKLKRPELKNRKFPSQDIWEDSPNSLHYTATVSTPQLPEDKEENVVHENTHAREGETPEQAFARRQEELAEEEAMDSDSFLNREKKPWSHKSHLTAETRPGMKQRFPSKDIWEDSPDSLMLQTTVATPQLDEKDVVSPPEERPTTGAVVYHQEKAAAGLPLGNEEGRATTGLGATIKPPVPVRPTKQKPSSLSASSSPTDATKPPPLPVKSKPQVPARPAKPTSQGSSDNVPLSKINSGSSVRSVGSDQGVAAATTKPKPPVPSRPVGSKIAALQSGFMSDLNKRLQLGPQAPKKEDAVHDEVVEEKEKAPLADARKGRARGPARRAPAKSPTPASEEAKTISSSLSISNPSTLWSVDPDEGILNVWTDESSANVETTATQAAAPALATNTAGASLEDLKQSSAPTPPTSIPSPDVASEVVVDNLSESTGTLKPEYESTDESQQTGEHIIHTNTGADDDHATAGTKERLVAYIGGAAPDEGDVIQKEPAGSGTTLERNDD